MSEWLRSRGYLTPNAQANGKKQCLMCPRLCRKQFCSHGCRLAYQRQTRLARKAERETQAIENVLRHAAQQRRQRQRNITVTQEDAWLNRTGINYEG